MQSADYWRERAKALEKSAWKQGIGFTRAMDAEFEKASQRIQADIAGWYQRFARNNQISLPEAKRLLNSAQLKELQWNVQDYIRAGKEAKITGKWGKELENASARVHISRLEALQLQIQQEAEILFGNHVDSLDKLLGRVYSERYYHTAFDIQRGTRVGQDLQQLDSRRLETVLSRPWTTDGLTFRDRVWKNKTALVQELHSGLTQAIIRGENPEKVARMIEKRFGVAKGKARRLAMTESAYISARSQQDCYHDLNIEQFEIIETLDSGTCAVCQSLDGKVLPLKDYEPGVTAPPFHPNCRGCTAPYFPDEDGQRIARGEDGEQYYIPADMTYEQWKASFVDGGEKESLQLFQGSDGKGSAFDLEKERKEFLDFAQTLDEPYKSIYTYYGETTEFRASETLDAAFGYSIREDCILYNPKHPDFGEFSMNTVILHELAHRYDVLNIHSWEDSNFTNAIEATLYNSEFNIFNGKDLKALMLEDPFSEDILNALGLSDSVIGHSNSYWNIKTRPTEIFANLSALYASNSKNCAVLLDVFPEILQAYNELIKGGI